MAPAMAMENNQDMGIEMGIIYYRLVMINIAMGNGMALIEIEVYRS